MKTTMLLVILALFFLAVENIKAEPVPETFVGKITVSKSIKIDAKSRKELATIAEKIKKLRKSGSVRIVGAVPASASQDDFITDSVFVARNAETHLRKLLPQSFQIYVAAAKFEGSDSTGNAGVSIYLYPHELRQEGAKFISTDIAQSPSSSSSSVDQKSVPDKSLSPREGGLLSQPQRDDDYPNRKSAIERSAVEAEDAAKAEELVNKAKARAAKRARQLENQ